MARTDDEINAKIQAVESKLNTIEKAMNEELKRPFFHRRQRVFHFLNLEKKAYSAVLTELKWVLNG
jgi:hypothetical protein